MARLERLTVGVSIVLVELVGRKNKPHYSYPHFITKEIEWFSCFRYYGDKEFHKWVLDNGICKSEDDDATYPDFGAVRLWRVADYDLCKQWIQENIPDVNQERLIRVIDYMKEYGNVYFDFR